MRMGPARIATPVGALEVSVSVDGDVRVTWRSLGWDRDAPTGTCRRTRRRRMPLQRADGREALTAPAAARVARSIGRWLQGDASALRGLPLPAGTPWQEACWRAARRIPWGQTRTYLWLASEACRELGRPASAAPALARAAGQAMRRNPVPIIVPCHRVVSASGLGGYAGADSPRSLSLSRKRWLLQLEAGRDRNPVDSVPRHAAGP